MYAEPLISLLAFVVSLGFFYDHRAFPTRLGNATAIIDKFVDSSGNGILPEQMRQADCVAVIPGFKKTSTTDYTVFGRGFITCHNSDHWSAPGAVILESSNPAVKIGAQKIDIVILSMDSSRRPKLLSNRFAIGGDGSAAWANGKSQRADLNAKVLFFGRTKSAFAEFDLDGAMLKSDDAGNKALYGKAMPCSEIIDGVVAAPKVARVFASRLTATFD